MQLEPLTYEEKIEQGLINANGQINWRHQDDKNRDAEERFRTRIQCDDITKTEAHHAIDLDLNNIVQRFGVKDGALPPAAVFPPEFFGTFTEEIDLRTVMDRIKDATDRFNQLPAKLKNRFGNDPAEMYRFVTDPENTEESVKLGLLQERKEKTPEKPVSPST